MVKGTKGAKAQGHLIYWKRQKYKRKKNIGAAVSTILNTSKIIIIFRVYKKKTEISR